MSELVRFGVSMDARLLERFDNLIEDKGYANRSEAVRDLVRGALVDEIWADGEREAAATVTIVYDHHARELSQKLTHHQHEHYHEVASTLHVHLDHHHCLEVIVLKGRAAEIRRIAEELIGTKGVVHGKLVLTTTGQDVV